MTVESAPSFRDARPADLPEIVAMLADDMLGESREALGATLPPGYEAALKAITDSPHSRLIVMEHGPTLIGCYQVTFIPGLSYQGAWKAIVEGVRVASRLRGAGFGTKMLRHAIEIARLRGVRTVELTTNKQRTEAHRFYRALGFEPSHEGMKLVL